MELYHVLNRGVDKRAIFNSAGDCARFVHDLYEFNDRKPAPTAMRRNVSDFVSPTSDDREQLVEIHGWCLMKNHYHLLLSEVCEGGLVLFLRKLNIGYAKYFNNIHERTGTLFEGRTKKILINRDAHFLYILHYIHLNPLDFLKGAGDWRKGEIVSASEAMKYLHTYRWSSFYDYIGKKNFPSILTTSLFTDVHRNIKKATADFLKEKEAKQRM